MEDTATHEFTYHRHPSAVLWSWLAAVVLISFGMFIAIWVLPHDEMLDQSILLIGAYATIAFLSVGTGIWLVLFSHCFSKRRKLIVDTDNRTLTLENNFLRQWLPSVPQPSVRLGLDDAKIVILLLTCRGKGRHRNVSPSIRIYAKGGYAHIDDRYENFDSLPRLLKDLPNVAVKRYFLFWFGPVSWESFRNQYGFDPKIT